MTVRAEEHFSIDGTPDEVMNAMRDRALIDASERSREASSVKITDLESSDEVHRFEIVTRVPARTVKGIDRSKTEENRTVVRWDLSTHRGSWQWYGPHEKAKVTGTYSLRPDGQGSRLVLTAEIEIGIPLVGKMIEKKVRDGFQAQWPDYANRIRAFVKR